MRVSQSTLPPCFPFHLLADLGLGGAGLPVYATPRVSHSTYLLILVSVVRVSQSTLPPCFPFHLLADLGLSGAGLPVYVTPHVLYLHYPRVSHSTYLLILVSVVRVSRSMLPPCFPFHLLADLGLSGAGLPVYVTPRVLYLRYPRVSHSTYLLILVSVVRVSQSTLPPCFPFHLLADLGLSGAGLPVYVTPHVLYLHYPRVSHSTYLLILVSVVRVSRSTLPPCFPFHLLADLGLSGAGLPVYVTPHVLYLHYPRVSHSTYLLILVSVVRVSQSTLPPCFPFHLLADLGLGGAGLPVYVTPRVLYLRYPRVSHSTYLLILVSVVRVCQ